jgi:hypothetical protein
MQQSSVVGITEAPAAGIEIQEELARCDLQLSCLFRMRRLHENFRLLRDVAGRQGWAVWTASRLLWEAGESGLWCRRGAIRFHWIGSILVPVYFCISLASFVMEIRAQFLGAEIFGTVRRQDGAQHRYKER